MLSQLVKLKEMALDFVFPQWCVGCGKGGAFICQSCSESLPRISPPICPKCGNPEPDGELCNTCTGWQTEIDGIRSPFRFEGTIRQAIHELKYRNLRALTSPLSSLLHDYLAANPIPGQVLVPVPLHQKRIRERGYNQSSLLAHKLGQLTNIPVVDDCLIRVRPAPPQARTSTVAERYSNVANAFSCRDQRLQNKQILLIDDVCTSGATLEACAAALKSAGATSVWGLALARET